MTVTRWARMRAMDGSGNVEVREVVKPSVLTSRRMVCIEADSGTQLTEEAWDELVADVDVLLGRTDVGSPDSAAGGS